MLYKTIFMSFTAVKESIFGSGKNSLVCSIVRTEMAMRQDASVILGLLVNAGKSVCPA